MIPGKQKTIFHSSWRKRICIYLLTKVRSLRKVSFIRGITIITITPRCGRYRTAVMSERFQGGASIGPWCREAPVSRTAVRQIVIQPWALILTCVVLRVFSEGFSFSLEFIRWSVVQLLDKLSHLGIIWDSWIPSPPPSPTSRQCGVRIGSCVH